MNAKKLLHPADPVGHDGVGVSLWKARDLTPEASRQPRSPIIKRGDSKKVFAGGRERDGCRQRITVQRDRAVYGKSARNSGIDCSASRYVVLTTWKSGELPKITDVLRTTAGENPLTVRLAQ